MNPLKLIADNPALVEALEKLLMSEFTTDSLSLDKSDEYLGQVTRANLYGIERMKNVMRRIEKLKTLPNEPVEANPAR